MTRTWAPAIKALQDAIVAAVTAERTAQLAQLPVYLQGTDLAIVVGLGSKLEQLKPHSIRVLPPENSKYSPEVTNAIEGNLTFPVLVTIKTLDPTETLTALREAVGLVIDGVQADPSLGGLCSGPDDPAFEQGTIETEGAEARQEVYVRLIARG